MEESLELLPQRAIYWPKEQTLIIADLHFGKINHFRRSGVAVPLKANEKNVEQLIEIIQLTKPKRVILLGDLFHSHYNEEWEVFGQLVRHFVSVQFELVIGNHDILSEWQYLKYNIGLQKEIFLPPFLFTHHPIENVEDTLYNLAGHVHPGVQLSGKGKQRLTLPCFYFGERQGLLPAFGTFTGIARVQPKKNDQVFVIVEDTIMKV